MISHKDFINGFNIAIEESDSSLAKRKVGSVILDKNGKVISKGHDSDTKKHSIMTKFPPKKDKIVDDKYIDNTSWNPNKVFLHSECDAIRKVVRKDLSECVLIVVRKTKTGKITMAKPCGNCMSVIKHYKIKEIVYSDWNGEMIREKINYD